MLIARVGMILVAVAALAACSSDSQPSPLRTESAGPVGPTTTATGSTAPSGTAGASVLTRGSIRLTVRPRDASRRDVLDAYLGFFAAYADALAAADPGSAELRRRSSPGAFADFSASIAGNKASSVTLRGPIVLTPALRASGPASLTTIVVDCLDATGQRFYRAGKATGDRGDRRPIQVELVDTPGPVRWTVRSIADGPAAACQESP